MTQSYGFRRWYLGLGLFCIFWLLALLLAQLNAPADGFSDLDGLTRGPVTAMEQLTRAQTGLQPGDEVLAINGLPVAELRQRAFTFAKPPVPLQIGVPARYTVLRQGRRLDIWVTPVRLSLAELLLKRRFNLLSGAIFWLIGLAVFWRKPRERAAQIFYLASLGLSMSMLSRGLFALQPADLANQTPFLIFSSIEFVTFWLNFPLILHIFLIFPRKSPLLTKAPWLIPLAYPTLAVLSLALGFAQGANLSTALARMDQIRFPIAMVYVIVGVGNQFYAFFTTRTRTERNQLRWIVWGIGVGGTPWLFFFALPQALFGQAWVSVDVFSLFLSIVPISFGFSIVKYRLFDIDTLIHRSLVYGLVSLMLGGVYLLLVALLARLLPLLGLDATSPALTVVVVIVVAAIFTPARERLQRVIDRAFFQDRLAFEQLPLQVSRELSGAVQLPAIITLLTRTIPQRLQITAAELSVFDLRRKRWVSYRGTEEQPPTVPVTAELATTLRQQEGAIALYDTADMEPHFVPFFEQAIEVAIPLAVEQELIGLYNIFKKNSGDYYRTEEVEILSNLGYQAATSLDNALKFQQIRQLNLDLDARAKEYQALYQKERRRATQLTLINEVGRQATSILEIDRLLDTVVNLIKASFDFHQASIGLIERDSGNRPARLRCVASTGDSSGELSPVGLTTPLTGKGITNRVARTGRPALVKDVTRDPDYVELEAMPGVAAELTVPLITQDGVIGVLDLVSLQRSAFDADDLTTMQTLAGQIAVAIENARLYETQAEQERLKQELLIARNIQTNLLPQHPPTLPGLKIFGLSMAAEEVGGDFFNYVEQGEGQLGVAVGDVSGKGLSGSLFMAVSITALRAQAPHFRDTSALLQSLNQLLYPQLRANRMNAAILYLHFNLVENLLQVGNAGLVAPLVVSSGQKFGSRFLDVNGLPLGAIYNADYRQQTISVHPGDLIVACSDGIIEAMNPRKELYGFTRLEEKLIGARRQGLGPQKIVQTMFDDVTQFMDGGPQHDDMTIVAVEVAL